jgi:hypothetical protein
VERQEAFAGSLLKVNPPTFRWPEAEGAGSFQIEISRASDFRAPMRAEVRETFFRPLRPLAPGMVWWRYRARQGGNPGPWSRPESFDIRTDLPRWEVPDWKTLLTRVPKAHPRILLRPEQVEIYRQRAQGPLRAQVERWTRDMERLYGEEFSIQGYEDRVPRSGDAVQKRAKQRWASRDACRDLMAPVTDMCWLWLATQDGRAAAEARRRVLIAAKLDPNGFTSHRNSDFGNAAIVSHGAVAYDILYDQFTASERAAIRKMLVERNRPIMEQMRQISRSLMLAHGWQHKFYSGVQGALALCGEEPVAAEWLELGLKSFVAFYPWFGGADGGSQEGAHYYTAAELISSLNTRDLFLAAFGIDFAKENPWYRANPYFLIYSFPPGSLISSIADNRRGSDPPGWTEKLAALRMADLYDNGYAADYAARIPIPEDARMTSESLRWFSANPVKLVSLENLPAARCFRDVGLVSMHSAYTRPEENVRMEFRSSPYGGAGHGHADQNSFQVMAYNEPLLIDSGYYTPVGDPHHEIWTSQTKAHNGILVDGKGQADDTTGYGTIRHFEQNDHWVYTLGCAAAAYKGIDLERFDRHVVWLKGGAEQTYVIIDDLRAGDRKPHRFDWLLHAQQEMKTEAAERRVRVGGQKGEALVSLLEPSIVAFEQTDKFEQPAIDWRPGPGKKPATEMKKQWHLRVTPPPSTRQRFVAVIQVGRPGVQRAEVRAVPDGARIGEWMVRLVGERVVVERAR